MMLKETRLALLLQYSIIYLFSLLEILVVVEKFLFKDNCACILSRKIVENFLLFNYNNCYSPSIYSVSIVGGSTYPVVLLTLEWWKVQIKFRFCCFSFSLD